MHDPTLSTRPGEAARAHATWSGENADVAAMEEHASAGCSVCARALVNGREMAVSLALSAPAPSGSLGSTPRTAARSAGLLDRVRATMAARRSAALPRAAGEKVRVLDASAAVAHKHIGLAGEAERIAEIDALAATETRAGDGSQRLLAQVARFIDFEIFFVSIVRGERAVARVQRGLGEAQAGFRELRREMSYCTHCVSGEIPLVVENAFEEPFFRGSKAATRFRIAAYLGVPLRTANGVVVGTLCALDSRPRAIAAATVELLSVFGRRAIAEIERERTPALLGGLIEASSERGDVCTESYFRDLVAAEHARAEAAGRTALCRVRAESAQAVLGWIEEHETVGRLDASTFGVLLPGAGFDGATERLARLRDAGAEGIGFSIAGEARAGG